MGKVIRHALAAGEGNGLHRPMAADSAAFSSAAANPTSHVPGRSSPLNSAAQPIERPSPLNLRVLQNSVLNNFAAWRINCAEVGAGDEIERASDLSFAGVVIVVRGKRVLELKRL